jgi:hypothetical protein
MSDTSAIKVDLYGGSYSHDKVTLHGGDHDYRMRLPGTPTELIYKFPPGMELGWSLYSNYFDQLDDVLEAISAKHGVTVAKNARAVAVSTIIHGANEAPGNEALIEDVGEILDHLITLLKAKLMAHASAAVKRTHAELKSKTAEAISDLQQVLAKGESAIKPDPRKDK